VPRPPASGPSSPRGVTVAAVGPGPVATELYAKTGAAYEAQMIARTPLDRIGQPEDIADAVAFLAGDQGGWITGQAILVAGGMRV